MPTPQVIDSFSSPYDFLSNFHPSNVPWSGHLFPTAEHAFQWNKTDDPQEQQSILLSPTAAVAKSRGRHVTLRPDWDFIKLSMMNSVVRLKFMHNQDLGRLLVNTGDALLVEGNTWGDTYWGVCNGRGTNWLGIILMLTRSALWRL